MNKLRYWWFTIFVLLLVCGMLIGAEANVADARRHGYQVPHLWQPYK